jgi:hypothetical protein
VGAESYGFSSYLHDFKVSLPSLITASASPTSAKIFLAWKSFTAFSHRFVKSFKSLTQSPDTVGKLSTAYYGIGQLSITFYPEFIRS